MKVACPLLLFIQYDQMLKTGKQNEKMIL